MKLSHVLLVAASVAFVPSVHADPIPWTYAWSSSPSEIHADSGPGTIQFTQVGTQGSPIGNTGMTATYLTTYSTAPYASPDVYTAKPFTLTLTLTDTTSGQSNSLYFKGLLHGTVSMAGADISDSYTNSPTQSLVLGNSSYTITLDHLTHLGQPGTGAAALGAFATVTVSHVRIESLPEPGTLALSLLGLAVVGAGRKWLPRRGRRAMQ